MKSTYKGIALKFALVLLISIFLHSCTEAKPNPTIEELKASFKEPPFEARPGVYWYFMDGNLDKDEMTKDLESMKEAGMNHLIFLEVNVGIPRGNVDFMSDQWLDLFAHAEREARRLGIAITLGVGPGWTGSGGPWVQGKESMKHLIGSTTIIEGGKNINVKLPVPEPHEPFFGTEPFTRELLKKWKEYYEDVAVLALPRTEQDTTIQLLDRKSLVYRYPYTSDPRAFAYLDEPSKDGSSGIPAGIVIDLTDKMDEDGMLDWDAPDGEWQIMRFVSRNNGASSRPAPLPGVGFEVDKFDTIALKSHLDSFLGKIFERIGSVDKSAQGGLKMLHMDSWEMGAQNWTAQMREEFLMRKGYDPLPYYPALMGIIIDDLATTERFLWDLRTVSQDLIIENHAGFLKKYANKRGLGLSIEPYDMNPTSDLLLGSVADVPMAEFWTDTFNASFAVIQASSIAHINGKNILPSEAFTSGPDEKLNHYPGSIKNIGDWALAGGVNRFMYHTFAHKSLGDDVKPGMTMGPYGVHWDRGQTWWPLVKDYHTYISRSSYILQQGSPVVDILFLTPEGAPHAFVPPPSALKGTAMLPDKLGYGFDGVPPQLLMEKASVVEGKINFPGGASYELLVLPKMETMTPDLLQTIEKLLKDGAKIVGVPPKRSPSLSNYPKADEQVKRLADSIWVKAKNFNNISSAAHGKGLLYYGKQLENTDGKSLYPSYSIISAILKSMDIKEDFAGNENLRYIHRKKEGIDIYFVSNASADKLVTDASFRVKGAVPQLWDPIDGTVRNLPDFESGDEQISIPLEFAPYESYFIIFSNEKNTDTNESRNFKKVIESTPIEGPWQVNFEKDFGSPGIVDFPKLQDWSEHKNDSIKYYSGIATYNTSFNVDKNIDLSKKDVFLNLNELYVIAEVSINGQKVGTVWTAPWRINIKDYIRNGDNKLEVKVANQWANRLIGDERYPNDGIINNEWPDWLLNNEPRDSKRISFVTYPFFKSDDSLKKSGLIGPVYIEIHE